MIENWNLRYWGKKVYLTSKKFRSLKWLVFAQRNRKRGINRNSSLSDFDARWESDVARLVFGEPIFQNFANSKLWNEDWKYLFQSNVFLEARNRKYMKERYVKAEPRTANDQTKVKSSRLLIKKKRTTFTHGSSSGRSPRWLHAFYKSFRVIKLCYKQMR